jgi:hypothetical protein
MTMSTFEPSFADRRWPGTTGLPSSSWRPRLRGLFERGLSRLAAAQRVRRDTGTILSLDERMLRDIGLTRAHVERQAHFGRW